MDPQDINILRGAAAASTLYRGRAGDTPFTTLLQLTNTYGLTRAPSWAMAALANGERGHGSDFQRMVATAVSSGAKSYAGAALSAAIMGATPGLGQALAAGAAVKLATNYVVEPVLQAVGEVFTPDVPFAPSWVYPYLDTYRNLLSYADAYGVRVPPEYLSATHFHNDDFMFFSSMSEGEADGFNQALSAYIDEEIAVTSALRARAQHESDTGQTYADISVSDFDLTSYGIDPSRIKRDPDTGVPYAVRGDRGTVLIPPNMSMSTFDQLWNNYS